jgi:hypothetical protein
VHKLLAEIHQLAVFQNFPFMVIKAWAASDGLVVDSEDSVAVALARWASWSEGARCNTDQFKELSDLVRVKHLTPGTLEICHSNSVSV